MSIFRIFQILILGLFFHCFPTPKAAGQFTDEEFNNMAKRMAKGSVKDISIDSLQSNFQHYLLLDTREKDEFQVSHLKDAKWVGYKDFNLSSLEGLPKDKAIITYCSVGYRSEKIGEQLQEAGFSNVQNLSGGIFAWINYKKPVYNLNQESTPHIHPYNEKWGKWLRYGEKVYKPNLSTTKK